MLFRINIAIVQRWNLGFSGWAILASCAID
jgi:hypothetical protein